MVPDRPDADGAAVSREAREFWSKRWTGRSLMAVGAQDPVLGLPVMQALRAGHPRLPRADGDRARPAISCRSTAEPIAQRGGGILPPVKKHIYIYSPSSAVRDKAVIRRGVARLKALGHEVELDEAVFATHMRFAGDDETRLAAIHRAAASGADVALITRGGYGLTRLLPGIRYKAVAKAIDKGMRFVGLSDFTAFQSAVLAETGAVTWSGPALGEDFGVRGRARRHHAGLLRGPGERAGRGHRLAIAARRSRWTTPIELKGRALGRQPGDARQRWSARRWMPKIKGGILFLEDVHEHPYRVERMLTQLLYAGVLARQKAILLGHFTNYKPVPHDKGYRLQTVVEWLRRQVKAPVFTNLPFGHVATKVALPVGAKVHLAVEGRDAFVLWGHRH